jgi:hypothetical protein
MNRPDFSDLVAHFTKDADPFGKKNNPNDVGIKAALGTAKEKLLGMLPSGT